MRKGNWKLRLPRTQGRGEYQKTMPASLFNLAVDISEEKNVAEQHPDLLKDLIEQALAFEANLRDEARPQGKL
jgi:hypothetical protein